MSKQLESSYLWSAVAVCILTVASGNKEGSEAYALLGDIKATALPKYALPLTLLACGSALFAMRRPRSTLFQLTEYWATKMLGAWAGIAATSTGFAVGVAILSVRQEAITWPAAAAIVCFSVIVFLSPWHILSEAVDALGDYRTRLFVPQWKRNVAAICGGTAILCGVASLALAVAGA